MRVVHQRRFVSSPMFVLSLVMAASVFSFIAQSYSSAHSPNADSRARTPASRQNQTAQRCSSCPSPTLRKIYVPAIGLPEARKCEIVLNSRSAHEIEVTPTFYTETGDQIPGEPLKLQPAEIRFARIDSLIPRDRRNHNWGGMTLSYVGTPMEVWAQITFHGVGGRGSIDETFNVLGDQPSDTREAVWWMPKRSTAIIALGNSSDVPIQATADFSNGESKQLNIAPFATQFIRRHAANGQGGNGTVESIKITTNSADAMRVAGFIVGGEKNFDSSIRFADTKKAAQRNLYATNLRMQNTEPHMVLKNTGLVDISARPRFFSAAGQNENPVELSSITLRPNETVDVDLTLLRQAAASRSDLDTVSVNVMNSGAPGSLIGAWYGTDTIKQLTYDVPLRDSGPIRNSTGSYPWRTDQDYTTIVNITNISDHSASFIVDIRYPGGHYFVPANELPAGGTARFDLRKIISEQKPDNQGNVIPISTTGGQFHWSIFGSPSSSRFIGRSEVISSSKRVSSSYSCPGCCPDSGPFGWINPPPSVGVGNSFTASTTGVIFDGCTGYSTTIGWFSMEFWMDDFSIASYYPASGSSTLVQGLAVGQTSLHGSWYWQSWVSDGWSICWEDRGQSEDSQPINVTPTIDNITPGLGPVDSSVGISIVGSGFGNSPTVNVGGTGVTASVQSASDTSISVTLNISAASSSGGNHSITVTANGQPSNPANFFVQIPTKLERISMSGVQNEGGCGAVRNLSYRLLDQNGDPIATNGTVSEGISGYSGPPGVPPPTETQRTMSQGVFPDVVGYDIPTCPPPFTATFFQNFTVHLNTAGHAWVLSSQNSVSMGRTSAGVKFVDITLTP